MNGVPGYEVVQERSSLARLDGPQCDRDSVPVMTGIQVGC